LFQKEFLLGNIFILFWNIQPELVMFRAYKAEMERKEDYLATISKLEDK